MPEVSLSFTLKTMPDHKGTANLSLEIDKEAVHIFLGKREVWIEVSNAHELIVRTYHDQRDDCLASMTITDGKVVLNP